jgi:hypothetical protein
LWRLLGIVETLRKGKVSPDGAGYHRYRARHRESGRWWGIFLLAFERALPLLMEKARHSGMPRWRLTAACTFRPCLRTSNR